jgi:hypothetical protein
LYKTVRYTIFSTFIASELLLKLYHIFLPKFLYHFAQLIYVILSHIVLFQMVQYSLSYLLFTLPAHEICHGDMWQNTSLKYPPTRFTGTGFAGGMDLQPVPQPQQNPSTYPGVFSTCANP